MAFVGTEIVVVIFVAALLIWGPKKIPELAKALGQAKQAFEDGRKAQDNELN